MIRNLPIRAKLSDQLNISSQHVKTAAVNLRELDEKINKNELTVFKEQKGENQKFLLRIFQSYDSGK